MAHRRRKKPSRLPSRRGQRRNRQVDDEDRRCLLEVSKRLLEQEGTAALSVRRLAKEVGTSYQLVYTLYGGKEGLLNALFRCGFEELEATCRSLPPSASCVTELVNLALAYRRFAHGHRELYALMFGRDTPGFNPDMKSRRVAMKSFAVVRNAARRVFEATSEARRHFASAEAFARAAWSATHGHVVLELALWFGTDENSDERLEPMIRALAGGDARSPVS